MASFWWEAKKPNKQKKTRVFLVEGRPALDGGGRSGPTLEGRKKEGSGGGKNNTTVTGQQPGCSSSELQNPTDLDATHTSVFPQSRANLYRTLLYLGSDCGMFGLCTRKKQQFSKMIIFLEK